MKGLQRIPNVIRGEDINIFDSQGSNSKQKIFYEFTFVHAKRRGNILNDIKAARTIHILRHE